MQCISFGVKASAKCITVKVLFTQVNNVVVFQHSMKSVLISHFKPNKLLSVKCFACKVCLCIVISDE